MRIPCGGVGAHGAETQREPLTTVVSTKDKSRVDALSWLAVCSRAFG